MLFSDYFEIVRDAQQAILHMAKDQMATFDKVLLRQMDHAALSADAFQDSIFKTNMESPAPASAVIR